MIVWHSFNALIMLNTAKVIELFTHSFVWDLLTIVNKLKVQWPRPAHEISAYCTKAITPEAARKFTMRAATIDKEDSFLLMYRQRKISYTLTKKTKNKCSVICA